MNIPAGKIIIGLLVVMAIVLGIGLLQGGQGTTPSPPTPTPVPTPIPTPTPVPTPPTPSPAPPPPTPTPPTPIPTPETWKTYFNLVYPYSIEYPSNWAVQDSDKSIVSLSNPSGGWVGITAFKNLGVSSLRDYVASAIGWKSNNLKDFLLILSKQITQQGQEAWELSYSQTLGRSTYLTRVVVVSTPSQFYEVSSTVPSTSSKDYSSIFERVLLSFRYLQTLVSPTPTPTYETWIDEYEATYGELPVVPDWMLDLMPELKAGDRFRKGVIFLTASAQYWARRSPSEKDMILETVLWLGGNPEDYLWQMEQRRPP